ncbi:hypothetical protein F8M41_007633 [Gigaspora margarita]|uniref:Peptidase S1 domain-containing protein n=1 Tax=Gigaspora margarita TaxID=4874 RepID=A0A8H4A374_GIGMA|nr:hypothetical protein F8M41_007633 [Gigaspora margarita]
MVESDNIDKYDFGLINITGSQALQSMTTLIRNTDSINYPQLIIKGGIRITSYGAHVCKSGWRSHVTCGYIRGFNTISTKGDDIISKHLIFYGKDTYQIACSGDSGGPVFSYLQNLKTVGLSGIHSGHHYDFFEFVPLDIILNKGELELVKNSQ